MMNDDNALCARSSNCVPLLTPVSLVCLKGLYKVLIPSIYFSSLLLLNINVITLYSVRISSTSDTFLHAWLFALYLRPRFLVHVVAFYFPS
ncbi:hypothetical protein QBC37DRAFT_430280 [Rhypophila decipiens]|uniref:Uncharacterized protein n=1 Tax=Rhypophila decipiens TaxID=261697 RepID=A0AAN6XZM7_9PEZI|nr:hypothetical protein QBC37DRAFT_430280 [Rhypophila decipiens]